ncbi:MAG: LuxR C-terminal-related transcriptional regulator [Sedimenticolaceae bacterium]
MADLQIAPPLLKTKLHIPHRRPDMVPRSLLIKQLNERIQRKLTLITAPAGYGKTNLASEWTHSLQSEDTSNNRITWLSLEEADSEPIRFLSYVIAALQQVAPEIGVGALSLFEMAQSPPINTVLNELINDIAGLDYHIMLVLDDYHVISHPEIHEALRYLVEHQPHQMHLVITSREDPPLPLPRLRARGEMAEIRMHDLRFSLDETTQFFSHSMKLDLESEVISVLEARTEGWIAGLQLAGIVLKNLPDHQAFMDTFSGSHRYVLDYLTDEVLQSQDEEVRQFLVQTAILKRFNTDICQAVTGNPNSQFILEQLEQTNMFIVPLDHERVWYRYHHLFADSLLTELSKAEASELYKKASAWHEANDMIFEAVTYALDSADPEFMADMIDVALQQETIWSSGNLVLYSSWLEKLPAQVLANRPHLSLNAAFVLYLSGRFDDALQLIALAETDLAAQPASPEVENLLALVALYRGSIAAVRGDVEQAIELITFAQSRLPRADHMAHARAHFSLGVANENSGQADDAAKNFLRASEKAQSAGVLHLAVHARCSAAQVLIDLGRLNLAEQACRTAIDLAEGQRFPPLGVALSILGGIALERNDLASAEQLLNEGIALSSQRMLLIHVIAGMASYVHLTVCQGNTAEFLNAIDEVNAILEEYDEEYDVDRFYLVAAAHQARMHIFLADRQAVDQWAKAYQASRPDSPFEYAELTLVRYLLMSGDYEAVPSILQPLLDAARHEGRFRASMEIKLLFSRYCQDKGDIPTALKWLSEALEIAAPEGFIRIFLDEAPVLELLPQVRETAPDLVDAILGQQKSPDDVERPAQPQLPEPLTEQELNILALIVGGKTNQQIADELVVTLGTVKWHVHNILQKLGVNNRTQATIRAQELGLL